MPTTPVNLSDCSTTAANNAPASTDLLSTTDDNLRAHASILAKISDGTNALVTPALGTPASGVLTNATGLPVSTGISGLGTGVATFLATPTSANLAAAVTNETGSGSLVFGTSPTLTTPTINTAASVGGTWTASGTWTLPAFTLGGAITGGSQNISGLGTLGCGAITSANAAATNVVLSQGGTTYAGVLEAYSTSSQDAVLVGNGTAGSLYGVAAGITGVGSRSNHDFSIVRNSTEVMRFGASSLTLGSGITSISGGTNPSLNIGTGSLTAGNATLGASGINTSVLIGKSSDAYGALSFNGANTPATMVGWYGSSGDTNLYGKIPTGGTYSLQINNSAVGTFSSTGLAVTGAVSATQGISNGSSALDHRIVNTSNSGYNFGASNGSAAVYWGCSSGATPSHVWSNNAGTTLATLDASGNLGIGVTPSAWAGSNIAYQVGSGSLSSYSASNNRQAIIANNAYNASGTWKYANTDSAVGGAPSLYMQYQGEHIWRTAAYGTAGNTITWTTAMTLDASGNLVVGDTAAILGARFSALNQTSASAAVFKSNASTTYAITSFWGNEASGNQIFCRFATDSNAERGTIDYNRGGVVVRYNTTSDGNLKNIIGDSDLSKSIEILNSTRIRDYSWKDDESNKPQVGVIAQELYETFKGAVSVGGEYEETVPAVTEQRLVTEAVLNDDGEEIEPAVYETVEVTPATTVTKYRPWAVDKTAFTFHLVAGFQYLQAENTALKAQLSAIEARLAALESA